MATNEVEPFNLCFTHDLQDEYSTRHPSFDLDATVMESDKQEAYYTYLGVRGYQPVIAYWAERDLILMNQFGDEETGFAPGHHFRELSELNKR